MKSWTVKHLQWVKTLCFERAAQEATYLDYLHEVQHAAERVARLERAIDQAIETLPCEMRAVIAGLQALRGIKQVSAATIVAEVGPLSRFLVPSSSWATAVWFERRLDGRQRRRGAITKTGNATCGASPRGSVGVPDRTATTTELKKRQRGLSDDDKEIAWKAQHRLCTRYRRLGPRES